MDAPRDELAIQHAEEAAFLWHRRGIAVEDATEDLDGLDDLDARIDAHLDGLRLLDAEGWVAAVALAGEGTAMSAFPLAGMAFVAAEGDRRDALRALLAEQPAIGPAVAHALALLAAPARAAAIAWLWPLGGAARHAALMGALAVRAVPDDLLQAALADADPAVRSLGLRAIGACGRADHLDACRRALGGDGRAAAAWSLGLLVGEALDVLQAIGADDAEARAVLLRRLPRGADATWCSATLEGRAEVEAAVARADAAAVPWLIARLAEPALNRCAGAAIAALTGVDAEAEGLLAPPAAAPEPDDETGLDPDRDLPSWDPAATQAWWERVHERHPAGGRRLAGAALDEAALVRLLAVAPQPLRRAAAYEQAVRSGRGLPPIAAPAPLQHRLREAGWV